ncbi:DUF4062 domain-containing protein [Acinetobacter schindleri]|jgi:hypothetical protein|uniref:DUF4062 domain-containing protein n=1 Tax=Acinetobacter TaxID=469 RepID=UPI0002CE2F82|nr:MULTISPECIES: DUF4062 domain-containing protein [Acinetobacter]ENX01500.1 hypothetical protein F899_01467 [Acinetobacter sp. CIP 101934]MCU4520017.1 DUF4062 domain-containing protein [Acinetobacter schindleri]
MKKYQVFISSTYLDLINERQAAVEAILKAGHIPAGMELFTASNKSQWDIIKKWIDESDIYMLILGGRYGSIEPESGLSYTELEYNYALQQNKPLFAVVMEDEALQAKVQSVGTKVLELENRPKWENFKTNVTSYMCSFFEDYKDIKLAVHESIGQLEKENQVVGWIRADSVQNPQEYLDQILKLQQENRVLQQENVLLKRKKASNNTSEEDIAELIELFSQEKVSLKSLKKEEDSFPDEITVLHAIKSFQDKIVVGVNNSMNATKLDMFIFYELAPRLIIHNLMQQQKLTNTSTASNVIVTDKGKELLAYIVKNKL